jgi:hypothetical protein
MVFAVKFGERSASPCPQAFRPLNTAHIFIDEIKHIKAVRSGWILKSITASLYPYTFAILP